MRALLNLLVGFAFAVRSLLPVGFMLAVPPAPAGAVEIVICTGHGPQNLTLDDQGVPVPAKAPMSGKNICPYAAAGAVAVDQAAPLLLAHTVSYSSVTYRIAREIFHATPKPGALSARGPPSILI
jgi:hypothetical protein